MNSIPNITIVGKRERVRTSKTYEDTKVRRGRRVYLRVNEGLAYHVPGPAFSPEHHKN